MPNASPRQDMEGDCRRMVVTWVDRAWRVFCVPDDNLPPRNSSDIGLQQRFVRDALFSARGIGHVGMGRKCRALLCQTGNDKGILCDLKLEIKTIYGLVTS